jgi:hypothetical protein
VAVERKRLLEGPAEAAEQSLHKVRRIEAALRNPSGPHGSARRGLSAAGGPCCPDFVLCTSLLSVPVLQVEERLARARAEHDLTALIDRLAEARQRSASLQVV